MLIAPSGTALEADRAAAEIFRPPKRLKPSEAAAAGLRNEKGPWDPAVAPYMIEPLDRLADRRYQGIVFVGPARTGKTFGLVIAGVHYVVTCAPGDMLIVHVSQDKARKFSRTDLDRAIKHTPDLSSRMSPRAKDDNTFDKYFRSGITLGIGWPSAGQLSGDTLQYVMLTDYDRPEDAHNVGGEGSLWSQAYKRIETYMSRGKCLAESSPGEEYADPTWVPRTAHEAPPAMGIAALYNAGTRARWYVRCLSCQEHFHVRPGLNVFAAPEFDEVMEAVKQYDHMVLAESWAKVPCTHCGVLHEPHQRGQLNGIRNEGDRVLGATWLHEGMKLVDSRMEGDPRRTNIASYWLGGAAAAYQPWIGLMHKYISAVAHYQRTGDETELKSSSHMDLAWPYLPMAIRRRRSADELASRAEDWLRGAVPDGVRFLTAAVDVQGNRFVVTFIGWGVGLESWLIERFSITASNRPEGDRYAGVDPAAYVEDWNVLVDQVIERGYKAGDVELKPLLVLCDSGGREGVTDKAYEFWRLMRAKRLGKRFRLVKGVGNMNAPRVQETWPDARARKDRKAGRGDVPVWLLNVNVLKDGIHGDLTRDVPGPGYCHIPDWIDNEYFAEITAETRTAKGWIRDSHTPNEAFDLHAYNRAACIILRAEAIDWKNPPGWASPPETKRKPEQKVKRKVPSPRKNWTTQW